jgi:hypothetical protein
VLHHDPVFALERHHVRYGGERDQVEQMVGEVYRQVQHRHQRLHQLERHTGTAERGSAGGVAGLLGIHHGERGRQRVGRQVVIGDDDADAGRPRLAHGLEGGDAAVAGDDEGDPGRPGRLQARRAEVVTIA